MSAGFIGSLFTTPKIDTWYALINKPTFTPPNWLFGPVWTALYILMGVALFLVISREKNLRQSRAKKLGLIFFTVQLLLNTAWSIVFFGQQNIFLALICILLLWLTILITGLCFFRFYRPAAYCLVPYFIWVSFAVSLNYSLYILNAQRVF